MATCTAMGFLGKCGLHQDGIEIMHLMRLYENDKSTLCIETPTAYNRDGKMLGLWCCTKNAVDDLMLLAAVYALKDEKVIAACKKAGCPDNTLKTPWMMYDALESLPSLYELAKDAFREVHAKLVLTTLMNSQITPCLEKVKSYKVDLELCQPILSGCGGSDEHE